MVGAQHAAVIPVDVEALVDGDTRSIGLPTVPDHGIGTVASSETAVLELPQVRHAERLFGDPDYLLRVVARDLEPCALPEPHAIDGAEDLAGQRSRRP
jgi:hypothetical protein